MMLDEIDEKLREYAPRWRAAQPPMPRVDLTRLVVGQRGLSRRSARWMPVLAVAATVAVLAGGIGLIRPHRSPPTVPTTPTPGVVPWVPLPPSRSGVPATTLPPSPDPSAAAGLPPCHASDLRLSSDTGVAGGTRGTLVTITSTSRCQLGGHPAVTALDPAGRPLAVPTQPDVTTGTYEHPVAVDGATAATLGLSWSSAWCADEVTIATLKVVLPDDGGAMSVQGFGPSACYGTPGSGEKAPITVGAFAPKEFTSAQVVTVFNGVSVRAVVPESVAAGGRLRFEVVLTAPAGRDVPLAACPDYSIRIGDDGNLTEASYALNCAAVPYRYADGQAYLPAGVPVRFAMEADAPSTPVAAAKLVWQLDVIDSVVSGAVVEIR